MKDHWIHTFVVIMKFKTIFLMHSNLTKNAGYTTRHVKRFPIKSN